MWSISCSASLPVSGHHDGVPPTAHPSGALPSTPLGSSPLTSSPPPIPDRQMCVAPEPESWLGPQQATAVDTPLGTDFGLTAGGVAGSQAFGYYDTPSGTGVGILDVRTRSVSHIAPFAPHSGGLISVAVESPWVVWAEAESDTKPGWSLIAFNFQTNKRFLLVSDGVGVGHDYVPGSWPYPEIHNGLISWAEPLRPDSNGRPQSRVMVFDTSNHRSQQLDAGTVSSPVFAGPFLIWGKQEADNNFSFDGVTTGDLKPAAISKFLPAPDSALYLAGNQDYFAWSSTDLNSLTAYRFSTSQTTTYEVKGDFQHRVQFPELVGDYAVWYTSDRFSVMDLTTGMAFDVLGSAAAGNGMLALGVPTVPWAKGQIGHSKISILDIGQLPHLPVVPCS